MCIEIGIINLFSLNHKNKTKNKHRFINIYNTVSILSTKVQSPNVEVNFEIGILMRVVYVRIKHHIPWTPKLTSLFVVKIALYNGRCDSFIMFILCINVMHKTYQY